MGMSELNQEIRLMETNSNLLDALGPRPEVLIEQAEAALNLRFPPSYRSFLKRYGTCAFGGSEYYGIVDDDFVNSSIPNGIWLTLVERKSSDLPSSLRVRFEIQG